MVKVGLGYLSKYHLFLGVHTVKIIRYGTVPLFFIRFRYANDIFTLSMFSKFCRAR